MTTGNRGVWNRTMHDEQRELVTRGVDVQLLVTVDLGPTSRELPT